MSNKKIIVDLGFSWQCSGQDFAFQCRGEGLLPGWRAKIPHASWTKKQNTDKRSNIVTFSTDFKNGLKHLKKKNHSELYNKPSRLTKQYALHIKRIFIFSLKMFSGLWLLFILIKSQGASGADIYARNQFIEN